MIALYMRLSEADRDSAGDASCSIEGQDLILTEYVESHEDLAGREVVRFADDGFSGTGMERPQLQAMLALCRKREVDCVIVKDLSRLARDYIDAGDLVERVFPVLGVRFIAIAEGYDSARLRPDADDALMMGFENIANASYSRDVSMRVSASMRASWQRGEHVQAAAPFGYLYDKSARGHLRPDPVASAYVQRIFELACQGATTGQIAAQLNREGVPTPAIYARENAVRAKAHLMRPKRAAWDSRKVHNVLTRETYAGTLVGGLTRKASGIGATATRRTSLPDERIRTLDAHEPLVSRSDFAKAQEVIRVGRGGGFRRAAQGLFGGHIFCPECGWACRCLREHGEVYGYTADCDCGRDAFVGEHELENAVLQTLRMHAEALGIEADELARKRRASEPLRADAAKRLADAHAEEARLRADRLDAYERLVAGDMDAEDFRAESAAITSSIDACAARAAEIESELEEQAAGDRRGAEAAALSASLGAAGGRLSLNRALVDELVERVELASDGSVSVTFSFTDFLEGAAK